MKKRSQAVAKVLVLGLVLLSSKITLAEVISGKVATVKKNGTSSTSIIKSADVSYFDAYQNATVNMNGGEVTRLTLHDNSSASISGGDISYLQLEDHSSVRIEGVDELSWLVIGGGRTRVRIVASNVNFKNGQLSGYWGDGKRFKFWLAYSKNRPHRTIPA